MKCREQGPGCAETNGLVPAKPNHGSMAGICDIKGGQHSKNASEALPIPGKVGLKASKTVSTVQFDPICGYHKTNVSTMQRQRGLAQRFAHLQPEVGLPMFTKPLGLRLLPKGLRRTRR